MNHQKDIFPYTPLKSILKNLCVFHQKLLHNFIDRKKQDSIPKVLKPLEKILVTLRIKESKRIQKVPYQFETFKKN